MRTTLAPWLRLRARLVGALDTVRVMGALRAATEVPRWLLQREFIVLAGDLRRDRPRPGDPPPGLRLEVLTAEDVPALARLHPTMPESEVRRRWAEGQECTVGWIGEAAAYYRWDTAAPAYLGYLGKTFVPPPLTTLTLDVRTHPRFQGRGIGAFGAAFASRRSLERGHRQRVGLVARWNRHVVRYNVALGAAIRGTVGYRHAGLRRIYFATGDVRIAGNEIRLAGGS